MALFSPPHSRCFATEMSSAIKCYKALHFFTSYLRHKLLLKCYVFHVHILFHTVQLQTHLNNKRLSEIWSYLYLRLESIDLFINRNGHGCIVFWQWKWYRIPVWKADFQTRIPQACAYTTWAPFRTRQHPQTQNKQNKHDRQHGGICQERQRTWHAPQGGDRELQWDWGLMWPLFILEKNLKYSTVHKCIGTKGPSSTSHWLIHQFMDLN